MASLSSLAGGANYSVRLDPASAARIARLIAADARFQTYFLTAMRACVVKVQGSARDNASRRFANPTGNLLRNIQGYVASPYLGAVGVTPSVPYARRRELGFSGMTDRLGRYYPDDPGQYYLQDALKDNEAFIADTFKAATVFTWNSIAVP